MCRRQDLDFFLPIVRMSCREKCRGWRTAAEAAGIQCRDESGEAVLRANNKALFSVELKFTFSNIFCSRLRIKMVMIDEAPCVYLTVSWTRGTFKSPK